MQILNVEQRLILFYKKLIFSHQKRVDKHLYATVFCISQKIWSAQLYPNKTKRTNELNGACFKVL